MPLDQIDPYPWYLNKNLDLVVNEQLIHTRFTATQWADHWRPLLAHLQDLWLAAFPKRYLIAVAGPPGSGKSVIAQQLHWLIEKGVIHRDAHSVALPMDGFSYSREYLAQNSRQLPDGTQIPLSQVMGQPDTIDVVTLRKYMQALIARPEHVPWPGYSRFSHEVIPGKFRVHQSINIIIIEGNYVLLNRGQFAPIPPLFNLRIYVDAPAPVIIANLVDHHIRTGKEIDQAKDLVKRLDLPNARVAESTKHNADLIIERETNDEISAITWHHGGVVTTLSRSVSEPPEPPPLPAPTSAPAPVAHSSGHLPEHAPAASTHPPSAPPVLPTPQPHAPTPPLTAVPQPAYNSPAKTPGLPMRFTKMHGIGNDYIYVDAFHQSIADPAAVSRRISDRHFGIGGDGLILVAPPTPAAQQQGATVRMRMFNADGSEAEMCGNGVRCVAKFAFERKLSTQNPMKIETGRGILDIQLHTENGRIRSATVNMDKPILDLDKIPVDTQWLGATAHPRIFHIPMGTTLGVQATFVSMGNPHAIIYVDDVEKIDLAHIGPTLETHKAFPKRMNVHFVQVHSQSGGGEVTMRTWERGSGITLACGTGAAAVCVAGVLTGKSAPKILAHLPGGDLTLEWREISHGGDDSVYMTGPATEVFTGEWSEQ